MNTVSVSGKPSDYPRRILMTTCGLAPQVITETLYAIGRDTPDDFPTELWVVTTTAGKQRIFESLLHDRILQQLLDEYQLPVLAFDEDHILVIRDEAGGLLEDIQTQSDNACAADLIKSRLEAFTADKQSAVHVSLAGGRKTLSYFAGAALSLCGRLQDRMSHVLISPSFEMHPGFFYPPAVATKIQALRQPDCWLDTADAEVHLADIPFIRVKDYLEKEEDMQALSFADTVDAVNGELNAQGITLDLTQRKVYAGGVDLGLTALNYAWYSWMVLLTHEGRQVSWMDSEQVQTFVDHYISLYGEGSPKLEKAEEELTGENAYKYFWQRNSVIRAELKKTLGPRTSTYQIRTFGPRGKSRYGLKPELEITLVE